MLASPIDRRAAPFGVALFLLGLLFSALLHWPGAGLFFFVLLAGHLAFFRDPPRRPEGAGFLSPADGTITDIGTLHEDRYLREEAVKIGIFLSIFDGHITRAPAGGTVGYLEYQPGQFLNAIRAESSQFNESNWVGLEINGGRVLVRQVAGMIARRIYCDVQSGSRLERGQKFGIICYGSRVEVFIPARLVRVSAKPGQKVKAGRTVLGDML